jgi:hypothetical protein
VQRRQVFGEEADGLQVVRSGHAAGDGGVHNGNSNCMPV